MTLGGVAAISAVSQTSGTVMAIPGEVVAAVRELIAKHRR
jgi:hypothetical protein